MWTVATQKIMTLDGLAGYERTPLTVFRSDMRIVIPERGKDHQIKINDRIKLKLMTGLSILLGFVRL